MTKPLLVCALLCFVTGFASAQYLADDPDWQETEVPPPPDFDLKRLVAFDMPVQSQLKWGIDATTVKITKDGIIRYVVIAQSSTGVINAMYEGIRCSKAQFRRYARHNPNSGWVKSDRNDWMPLRQAGVSSHPESLAKLGLCDGNATASTSQEAIRRLSLGIANQR